MQRVPQPPTCVSTTAIGTAAWRTTPVETYSCAKGPRVWADSHDASAVYLWANQNWNHLQQCCAQKKRFTMHVAALLATRMGAHAAARGLHVVHTTHTHTCGAAHIYTQATTTVGANTTGGQIIHSQAQSEAHRRSQRPQQGLPDGALPLPRRLSRACFRSQVAHACTQCCMCGGLQYAMQHLQQ